MPHLRSSLVGLLWGEMPEANVAEESHQDAIGTAQDCWRSHSCRPAEHCLPSNCNRIRVDVEQFLAASATSEGANEADLRQAVKMVRGDFLQGFTVHNAADFEFWTLSQRARLRELFIQLDRHAGTSLPRTQRPDAGYCLHTSITGIGILGEKRPIAI